MTMIKKAKCYFLNLLGGEDIMPTVTLYKFENLQDLKETTKLLNKKFDDNSWLTAKKSKFNPNEIFIQYWHYEDIKQLLYKILQDDADEITKILEEHNKTKVLRRNYAFINYLTKTLEIYGKKDANKIKEMLEEILQIEFEKLNLSREELKRIEENYSFKTREISENGIVFIPKIRFLNASRRYYVKINSDGEIRFSANNNFNWKPRYEIRQLAFLIRACKGGV